MTVGQAAGSCQAENETGRKIKLAGGSLLLALLRRLVCFAEAGATQDVAERVICLVTGVLVHVLVGGRPRVLAHPRGGPRGGILDREPVEQRLRVDAREAL